MILAFAVAAGLAASSRGDLSQDMKVSVLMVYTLRFLGTDRSTFSTMGIPCIQRYGSSRRL